MIFLQNDTTTMMKEYIEPEMEIVEINCQNLLFNNSLGQQSEDDDDYLG